jgi:hypothetical protein
MSNNRPYYDKEKMMDTKQKGIPRWLFGLIAIGGLLSSGIFLGILSVEGETPARILQAAGFGLLGLVMFWGTLKRE